MEAKHTPGPWRLSETAIDSVVCDVNSGHDHPDTIAYYGGHLIAESIHTNANRTLIAAAPDLLEALQDLLIFDNGKPEFDEARAAIAKATGAAA